MILTIVPEWLPVRAKLPASFGETIFLRGTRCAMQNFFLVLRILPDPNIFPVPRISLESYCREQTGLIITENSGLIISNQMSTRKRVSGYLKCCILFRWHLVRKATI